MGARGVLVGETCCVEVLVGALCCAVAVGVMVRACSELISAAGVPDTISVAISATAAPATAIAANALRTGWDFFGARGFATDPLLADPTAAPDAGCVCPWDDGALTGVGCACRDFSSFLNARG